jgi:hypothetical protein
MHSPGLLQISAQAIGKEALSTGRHFVEMHPRHLKLRLPRNGFASLSYARGITEEIPWGYEHSPRLDAVTEWSLCLRMDLTPQMPPKLRALTQHSVRQGGVALVADLDPHRDEPERSRLPATFAPFAEILRVP